MEPNTIFWIYWMILIGSIVIFFFIFKRREDRKLEDKYNQQLIQAQEYPQIDIRQNVTDKSAPIEFLMEYPYQISGTCNKIDYITQRFRTWPTDFQINRFRHHCIYEYEKSGKSKVIDYADCDGYK